MLSRSPPVIEDSYKETFELIRRVKHNNSSLLHLGQGNAAESAFTRKVSHQPPKSNGLQMPTSSAQLILEKSDSATAPSPHLHQHMIQRASHLLQRKLKIVTGPTGAILEASGNAAVVGSGTQSLRAVKI